MTKIYDAGIGAVVVIQNQDDYNHAFEIWKKEPILAVDTETVGVESLRLWEKADGVDFEIEVQERWLNKIKAATSSCGRQQRSRGLRAKFTELYRLRDENKLHPTSVAILNKAYTRFMAPNPDPYKCYVDHLEKKLNATRKYQASLLYRAQKSSSGLHHWENRLGCVQIATPDTAYLFRPHHITNTKQLEELLNTRIVLIGHNFKFDWKMLKHHLSLTLTCHNLFDTMFAWQVVTNGHNYLIHPCWIKILFLLSVGQTSILEGLVPYVADLPKVAEKNRASLGYVTRYILGISLDKDKDITVSNWLSEWSTRQSLYGGIDTLILHKLLPQLKSMLGLGELEQVHRLECGNTPNTGQMELNGVGVDVETLTKELNVLSGVLSESKKALENDLGCGNIHTPKDVLTSLQTLGYEITDTNKKTLNKIKNDEPLVQRLLEYREEYTLVSRYLSPFVERSVEGRVYGSFKQTGTETGRYSSEDPNLQNLPATYEFRRCVVPREGYVFINGDQSSIEPRALAALSGEPSLLEAFENDEDPYVATASKMLNLPKTSVTKVMRKEFKAITLSTIYDKGPGSLSRDLGCSYHQAKVKINKFFWQYPEVEAWIREQKALARERGYVVTVSGRRRYLPDLFCDVDYLRAKAEREIINTIIQGSCADALKYGVLHTELPDSHKLVILAHDEAMLECRNTMADIALGKKIVAGILTIGARHYFPSVRVRVGSKEDNFEPRVFRNWGEGKLVA